MAPNRRSERLDKTYTPSRQIPYRQANAWELSGPSPRADPQIESAEAPC